LLTRYGLGQFLNHLPRQLSGGMRQRVALARTLCTEPDVVLLDEPFSALDSQTRIALADEIAEILRREGKTAILVTHDIGEAVSMAERVVVLSRRPGRVKSDHPIRFAGANGRPAPFAARNAPEFNGYFNALWKELEVHVEG
jgi:NitT/TauT family transport system ATP-binding protein